MTPPCLWPVPVGPARVLPCGRPSAVLVGRAPLCPAHSEDRLGRAVPWTDDSLREWHVREVLES